MVDSGVEGTAGAGLGERQWPVPQESVWGPDDGFRARVENWGLHAALGAAARLPEGALSALLGTLARIAQRFDRRRTLAARAFLRQAFGELPEEELARRTHLAWLHLLRVTVDVERFFLRVPPERTVEHFDLELSADTREVLRQRRGCIFVAPHLGNWELGLALTPWIGFHPVYGVAKPPK